MQGNKSAARFHVFLKFYFFEQSPLITGGNSTKKLFGNNRQHVHRTEFRAHAESSSSECFSDTSHFLICTRGPLVHTWQGTLFIFPNRRIFFSIQADFFYTINRITYVFTICWENSHRKKKYDPSDCSYLRNVLI